MILAIIICWNQEEVNASVSVLVAVLKNCQVPISWGKWTALPLAKIRPPQISTREGGGGVFHGARNHKEYYELSRAFPDWFPFSWQQAVCWIPFVKSGSHHANNYNGTSIIEVRADPDQLPEPVSDPLRTST
jgi:hypothetical protein